MSVEKSAFGLLIDGSDEAFREHCADKDLGYVTSLRNYIAGAYETFINFKEGLLKKIQDNNLPEESEEVKTLKGVYAEMMKLEAKATLCVEIINARQLKS